MRIDLFILPYYEENKIVAKSDSKITPQQITEPLNYKLDPRLRRFPIPDNENK